jgi:hypothetical protein
MRYSLKRIYFRFKSSKDRYIECSRLKYMYFRYKNFKSIYLEYGSHTFQDVYTSVARDQIYTSGVYTIHTS